MKTVLDYERDVEANLFAIELILEESRFRRAIISFLLAPDRPSDMRNALDIVDDPIVGKLAGLFRASKQMVVMRLCMLGYFEPYVRGRS